MNEQLKGQYGSGSAPVRLEGWKAIASYVDRGVRTVQRWETELGLPIRRLDTGTADTVFAFAEELDDWRDRQSRAANDTDTQPTVTTPATDTTELQEQPSAPFGPETAGVGVAALRRWGPWAIAALTIYAVILAPQVRVGPSDRSASAAAATGPARAVAAGSAIVTFGPDGKELWSHTFAAPISEINSPVHWPRDLRVLDVNGDGINEVLFARQNVSDPGLYLFSASGRQLWRHAVNATVHYAGSAIGSVWQTDEVFFLPESRTLAVSFHVPDEFAGVIQELDVHERVLGEFWTNGYVTAFLRAPSTKGSVTFVGAVFNETKGASLALFNGPLSGAAPASTAKYSCADCPPGGPAVFLVFPRTRLQGELAQYASVRGIRPLGPDTYSIRVDIGTAGGDDDSYAYYRVSADGRILDAEQDPAFASLQRRLEQAGKVTSATRPNGKVDLFPVLRWNGNRLDRVTRVETR